MKPVIPSDITAEARLLGALLYDQRHVSALPTRLTPETFFSERHRQVFEAICDLRDDRTDINVTTVETRLRAKGRTEQLTSAEHLTATSYLDGLVDGVPVLSAGSLEALAKAVLDRATQRAALLALQRAVARFSDPTLTEVASALSDVERELLDVSTMVHEIGGLKPIREALRSELTEWNERAMGRGAPGIPVGLDAYDAVTGGLHRGDLVVIAARPGMGKTSMITSIAVNVARRGESTAIFSLEMPARQLAGRMLCTEAAIPLVRTRAGRLDPKELTSVRMALGELSKLGIYVDDASRGRPYVADIVARTRRLAAQLAREGKRLGCVLVDYLQIVKLRDVLVKQRHELAVGEVSTELKALAKELDTTVIGCAQLNRGVETRQDKRPGLSDMRDSGQIEQDADQVVMLYRDEYYNESTRDPGVAEIIFEKNRHGPTGTRRCRFDGPTTSFSDLPYDEAG